MSKLFHACSLLISLSLLNSVQAEILCTAIKPTQQKLCVIFSIMPDMATQQWFVESASGQSRSLPNMSAAMLQVSDIAIDEQGQWLAVLSVGEGHPILEVFALKSILQNSGKAQWEINPYPGWLSLEGWQAGILSLQTDRLLSGKVYDSSDWPEAETTQTYYLNPKTGKLSRK
ncbi:hypothetical protein [Candidatus Venteria ishoeyi]|uniref:Phytase-like domain-containing protein n=1 Tax=Candidatus Venteria ishoeyi TaxID=1899563 RepID=A0A1H6F588_9GAMM|nr:hypothetical protein [Candidatus Venteria ishoeyi]SEH04185.1 Uncharacterised protein [Candidatus Venteria ishoeyi]SEH05574.1 Uncharacterised protein [Candidatus Venteria ishoeyi]SEH05849.1 Uncharacterised protein [Candidatus Venteria ishoeyi]